MDIRLTNTLGRKKSLFTPLKDGKVGMYVCGPTVYGRASIGNFRAYVFADLLRRMLAFNGLEVHQVMNITDVGHLTDDASDGDDKVEKQAKIEGKTAWEIVEYNTNLFLQDMALLNILMPQDLPRATNHIPEQIALIKALEKNGYTYIITDGMYFDTSKLPDYGVLCGQKNEEKEEGARVQKNNEKKNLSDFALWKFSNPHDKRQMEWISPWGIGFPGWHIECSAMSEKYLGTPFDIHTGGEDHVSVHHPNEMAQTEGARGHKLANWWLHNAFLQIDGGKMSKSLGNTYSLDDLKEKSFNALDYRYYLFGAHYRSVQNFTWEALSAAKNARENLKNVLWNLGKPTKVDKYYLRKFHERINDDLDIPGALAVFWEMVHDVNVSNSIKSASVLKMDEVFGLRLHEIIEPVLVFPDDVQKLIDDREQARAKKDYAQSDALRDMLEESGYSVKDTAQGQQIRSNLL